MRFVNADFAALNAAASKEPIYVFELAFDEANTDLHYFTSRSDAALPIGASSIDGAVEKIGGSTQKIDPVNGKATIGYLNFTLTDVNKQITALIHTKDGEGKSLRHKRVRAFLGYPGLTWEDYLQIPTTQRIEYITDLGGAYRFNCFDIQRALRNDIFVVKKSYLTQTCFATDLTLQLDPVTAANLQMVKHGPSYSDAPNTTVGYIDIDGEAIRYNAIDYQTGIVGVDGPSGRGALGTKAADHEVPIGATREDAPVAKEIVYLELPVIKMAFALLTNSLYGDAANIPDHWGRGIASEYIDAAAFVNIGLDLWNPADDTAGRPAKLITSDEEEAKAFLEKQLMILAGCYMVIRADGSIGLKRTSRMLSDAYHVGVLNERNIVYSGETLKHDYKGLHNQILINWNFRYNTQEFSRPTLLWDQASMNKYGESDVLVFDLRCLHGGIHTENTLTTIFDGWRDRVSSYPLITRLRALPSANLYEVGDVLRVNHPHIMDPTTGTGINRAMEVQGTTIDWETGKVFFDLFGSSHPATPLTNAVDGGQGIPAQSTSGSAFVTSKGTDLSTVPGITIDTGGATPRLTTPGGPVTLTGTDNVNDAGSIWYYDNDLITDPAADLRIANNVQLRFGGDFDDQAGINGKGGGWPGSTAIDYGGHKYRPPYSGHWGLFRGGSGGGGVFMTIGDAVLLSTMGAHTIGGSLVTDAALPNGSIVDGLPPLDIYFDGTDIVGIPPDLRGTPGAQGGNVYAHNDVVNALGGNGGASGAGLVIVAKSVTFTAKPDLGGEPGTAGAVHNAFVGDVYAGAGGSGTPGGCLVLLDGNSTNYPLSSEVLLEEPYPAISGTSIHNPNEYWNQNITFPASSFYTKCDEHDTVIPYSDKPYIDRNNAGFRVIHIGANLTPIEDTPKTTDDATLNTPSETTNSPATPGGNVSSINVSITPPAAANFSHCNIYYRVLGQSEWIYSGPADPIWVITPVPSDGTVYEIYAPSVSIDENESPSGPVKSITLSNVTNPAFTDTPVGEILPVPNVHGIEITGQGNDTNYIGQECKVGWRHTSISEWVDLGQEPEGIGGDAGALDQYFECYVVEVYDPATGDMLHTQDVTDNWYTYPYVQNAADYKREKGTYGSFRSYRIEVRIRSRQKRFSERAARLVVDNEQASLTALLLSASFQTVTASVAPSPEIDVGNMLIWEGLTPGFTVNDDSLIYDGSIGAPTFSRQSGTAYYYRYALYDSHGKDNLNISSEYSIQTKATIQANEVASLSNWATRIAPADKEFMLANVGSNTIQSTHIEYVVANKVAAGAIVSRISVAGVFTATPTEAVFNEEGLTAGTWRADWGPVEDGGVVYVARYHDGQGSKNFSLDDAGNIFGNNAYFSNTYVSGQIVIGSGSSGYASLGDKPTALSGINTVEGTKLAGIDDGADVTALNTSLNTDYVGSTLAATVESGAASGANAWSKFSGVGNTLPPGNVEFNFANSTSKGGNATNTDAVGTQSAITVQAATVNFDARNDRDATTVVTPTIAFDGTAVDHTLSTDGSANISLDYGWTGTDADIDGWIITLHQSASSVQYTFGTLPATEQVFYLTPEKRAFILYGVPANEYYTFRVQAYRIVDPDVDASGVIKSTAVQPTLAGEDPYRPSASVAFAGEVTGTIAGASDSGVLALVDVADWGTQVGGANKPADNADATKTVIDGGLITTGYVQLAAGGHFRSGKGSYPDTANSGFWRGYDVDGKYKERFANEEKQTGWDFDGEDFHTLPNTDLVGADCFEAKGCYFHATNMSGASLSGDSNGRTYTSNVDGYAKLSTGYIAGDFALASLSGPYFYHSWTWEKRRKVKGMVFFLHQDGANVSNYTYVVTTGPGNNAFPQIGFEIVNGVIYVLSGDGINLFNQSTGITVTGTFRVFFDIDNDPDGDLVFKIRTDKLNPWTVITYSGTSRPITNIAYPHYLLQVYGGCVTSEAQGVSQAVFIQEFFANQIGIVEA